MTDHVKGLVQCLEVVSAKDLAVGKLWIVSVLTWRARIACIPNKHLVQFCLLDEDGAPYMEGTVLVTWSLPVPYGTPVLVTTALVTASPLKMQLIGFFGWIIRFSFSVVTASSGISQQRQWTGLGWFISSCVNQIRGWRSFLIGTKSN